MAQRLQSMDELFKGGHFERWVQRRESRRLVLTTRSTLARSDLAVEQRSNHNKAACALAYKLARICYAVLRDKSGYAPPKTRRMVRRRVRPGTWGEGHRLVWAVLRQQWS